MVLEQMMFPSDDYYDFTQEPEMADFEGVIQKRFEKSGGSGKRAWTAYSFLLDAGDGGDGTWANFGFEDPGYQEGQTIKVRIGKNDKGYDTVTQHKLIANASTKGSGSGSGGGSNYNQGQAWGNASNVAASVLESLVQMDALPISAAKTKAAKATRFEEILEVFDKLRVKLYKDAQDIDRVLEAHADFGEVETNYPQPLPDGEIEEEEDPFSDPEEEGPEDPDDF